MKFGRFSQTLLLIPALLAFAGETPARKQPGERTPAAPRITYHTATIEGVNVFYREAGSPSRPTVVLLHGFPSSSHMYRNLIPALATQYHVIAPDYPGFGYSDALPVTSFQYTFDRLASITDQLLDTIGVTRYSIYIQDYGSPIGFRLATKHPERVQAIISQNGNAYDEGLSPFWEQYLVPFWKNRSPESEANLRQQLTLEGTKFQYTQGTRSPENISPDAFTFDQQGLDRPGNAEIQLALLFDYQNNLKLYPEWHRYLRDSKVPVLAVWGKNDPIFLPAGAEAFRRDNPKAEVHFFNTGHFALEEDSEEIARVILSFLRKNLS